VVKLNKWTQRRWFYPVVFALLAIISMLPPITERPYDPRNTQEVVMSILRVSTTPYRAWGWVFHVATLALIAWAVLRPHLAGRAMAAYFGVNYLLIAAAQTHAVTEAYGFALQTGALVSAVLLGALWLWVAWRDTLTASFRDVPTWRWTLLPLALLAFWVPVGMAGTRVVPTFDPLLLLTSVDYGLAFCFATPVFLFLLILFYPQVNAFAFRVTALNGLIYGLYNLTHWFDPDRVWMGVMHLPLLILSLVALFLPRREAAS
jgi:hypothetical protein